MVVCTWQGKVLRPLPLREITAVLPPLGGGNVAALDTANVVSFVHDVVRYLGAIEAACGVKIRRVGIDAPSDPKKDGTIGGALRPGWTRWVSVASQRRVSASST